LSSGSAPVDVVLAASPGAVLVEPDPAAPVDAFVAGFNEAGFDVWRRIAPTDNWVFGSMSIDKHHLARTDRLDDLFGPRLRAAHVIRRHPAAATTSLQVPSQPSSERHVVTALPLP
jgi:hypothetical protein